MTADVSEEVEWESHQSCSANNQVLKNAEIYNVRRIRVDRDFLAAKSADRKIV